MRKVKLVQDEHLWLKSIYIFLFLVKGPIVSQDETLIPQLGSPLQLHWNCNLDLQPVHYMEKNPGMFSSKILINNQDFYIFFILEVN